MITIKCDICGSTKDVYSAMFPVYRLYDGNDGLTQYEHPKVCFKDMDLCYDCLMKCTNIFDGTVMGYGDFSIRRNPELDITEKK